MGFFVWLAGSGCVGEHFMADTIASNIEADAIAGVQRVSVDGQSVDAMSIDDRIKAAKYLAGQQAASKNHRGLRFTKLIPPGGGA
jgi:hypothetical protein